jgi:hypothetical protein
MDKLSNLDGHKIPETPDMLRRGSRCGSDKISDEAMLAQHHCAPAKNPDKDEWVDPVCDLAIAYDKNPITGGTYNLDVSTASEGLPVDWPDPFDVVAVEKKVIK